MALLVSLICIEPMKMCDPKIRIVGGENSTIIKFGTKYMNNLTNTSICLFDIFHFTPLHNLKLK